MWELPPENLFIAPSEVHIWRSDLQAPLTLFPQYEKVLSRDERIRAQKFHFQKDRNQYITGRGILRHLISLYTQIAPEKIKFEYSRFGKPSAPELPNLQFNLSHAGGRVIYAFTRNGEIGIDLEALRKGIEIAQIAKRFFATSEREAILALPEAQRAAAFFHCWTCKEAFIKAHGQGLSLPLDEFEVDINPDKPAALKAVHWAPSIIRTWDIHAFHPGENFFAALVTDHKIKEVKYYDWLFPLSQ